MYGDADRQVASIIRNNSENKVNSVPRISVYVTTLALDRDRMADPTFVGKMHIRERDTQVDTQEGSATYGQTIYNQAQGKQYTIERLMPTPFSLKMKVDIWSSSTDQKLQILEQILVLFNPSLELQTTDNYIDWSSLSVINLTDINWDSKQVPVGNDTPISIATLTIETPIWISPPVKVKHLGVITKLIASMYNNASVYPTYIEGLGTEPLGPTVSLNNLLTSTTVTTTNYQLQIYNNTQGIGQAILLHSSESVIPAEPSLDPGVRQGTPIDWNEFLASWPGQFHAGSSQLFLQQPNSSYIVGTCAVNPLDSTILTVNWNPDTLIVNTGIDSNGNLDNDTVNYNPSSYRNGQPGSNGSPGTIDAIVNPQTYNPLRPRNEETNQSIVQGRRFLIIEDIGSEINADGANAWKSLSGADLIAKANDIIEWDGERWNIIFNSSHIYDTLIYQTNIYTGIQYVWNNISWSKSFEGEYGPSRWKLIL